MFQPNSDLLRNYAARNPHHQESLIDFGVVPQDGADREDWNAEVGRLLRALFLRGYQLTPAMYDGDSGLCPISTIRLDKGDFLGPTPVELDYLQWVCQQLCRKDQRTTIHDGVLEVHMLGDEEPAGQPCSWRADR